MTKLKNLNCVNPKNSNSDKTEKLKLSQSSKTEVVKKLKFCQHPIYDKTEFMTKLSVRIISHLDN